MLTVMCPNCRHRFAATGCCEAAATTASIPSRTASMPTSASGGQLLHNADARHPLPPESLDLQIETNLLLSEVTGQLSGGGCLLRDGLEQSRYRLLETPMYGCQNYCKSGQGRPPDAARSLCQVAAPSSNPPSNFVEQPGDLRIQVSATVHMPTSSAPITSCTLNITAATCPPAPAPTPASPIRNFVRNNFNGGGIVSGNNLNHSDEDSDTAYASDDEVADEAPMYMYNPPMPEMPLSWFAICPWGFDTDTVLEKDANKLAEVRRLLQFCGWYHEGLSWQQSENLLKNAPVGRWLMRDSSDERYIFAVSVQTKRGPTSVRVLYYRGKFRLDAEPRLAVKMPLFDCPIKMLEYYREYSIRQDEFRQEVWVDFSGKMYSQIFLSEPLLKEVHTLSHLARIAVNKHKSKLEKGKERLPPVIQNYLNEYPYTL